MDDMSKSPLPVHKRIWRKVKRIFKPKAKPFTRFTTPEGQLYSFQGGKYKLLVTKEGRRFVLNNHGIIRKVLLAKIKVTKKNKIGEGLFSEVGRIPKIKGAVLTQMAPAEVFTQNREGVRHVSSTGIKGMRHMQRMIGQGVRIPEQYFAVEEKTKKGRRSVKVMEEVSFPSAKQLIELNSNDPWIELKVLDAMAILKSELQRKGFKLGNGFNKDNVLVKNFDPDTGEFEFVVIDQPWHRSQRLNKHLMLFTLFLAWS